MADDQQALSDLELHLRGPLEDFKAYAHSEREHRLQENPSLDIRQFDEAVELVTGRIKARLDQ